MKIVLNKCFGGFALSEKAYEYLGLKWDGFGYAYSDYDERSDPKLIKCVETLGEEANGLYADLEVVDIPDNVKFEIEDYDGIETAYECGGRW